MTDDNSKVRRSEKLKNERRNPFRKKFTVSLYILIENQLEAWNFIHLGLRKLSWKSWGKRAKWPFFKDFQNWCTSIVFVISQWLSSLEKKQGHFWNPHWMQISNMEEILTFKKFLSVLESIQNDINKSVKTMVFHCFKRNYDSSTFWYHD